jgi:hypothetical protein
MGLLLTTTAALCLWVILWALEVKSFDAFMLALLLILLAATARLVAPFLPGNRPDPEEPS